MPIHQSFAGKYSTNTSPSHSHSHLMQSQTWIMRTPRTRHSRDRSLSPLLSSEEATQGPHQEPESIQGHCTVQGEYSRTFQKAKYLSICISESRRFTYSFRKCYRLCNLFIEPLSHARLMANCKRLGLYA